MSYTLGSTWRLPKAWETISLKEITSEWKGGAPFKPDDFTEEGFAVLHKGAIQKNGVVLVDPRKKTFTTAHYAKAHSKSVIDQSYMAVTLRDLVPSAPSIGLIADLAHSSVDEYILAQGAYGFQIDRNRVHPSYLVWLSNYEPFRKHMKRYAVGSTQVHIRTPVFQNITIPLPPLEEQKRIAAILDKADAVRRKRKKAIALTEELLRSTFLDMFGDPVTNPKGWDFVSINDIVSAVRDGPHVSPKYSDSGIPILSTRNIRPSKLLLGDVKYVAEETYSELVRRFQPKQGDVLLTKGGTTGYAKVVDWNWNFAVWVHLAVLRPKENVRPEFLEAALNSQNCYAQSQRYTHGIANRDLGLTRIRKIQLSLPPLELQDKYCLLREKIINKLDLHRNSFEDSDNLFNSLLQKAFRGEL